MRCDCCPACCAAHAQGQCPQDAPVYNAPIVLYSGITLTFLHYIDMDLATLPALPADALALHFCLTGRAGFALPEGGTRYLGDGEALLRLYQQPAPQRAALPQYPAAQTEVIRRVHDQLTQNLQQRVTIDELSHQFLMNPSTLKAVFKDVYGDSIAAHIREHRMERAAELLRGTELGMGQIAQQIGYESASKFSAEFRKHFGLLPSEYRKMHK